MGNDTREPPFFFLKPAASSLVDASSPPFCSSPAPVALPFPQATSNLHFEGEFYLALGGPALSMQADSGGVRGISPELATQLIFGVGVACDLTRRDLQSASKSARRPWCSSKGFDMSCPAGAVVPVEDVQVASIFGDGALGVFLRTCVNGKEVQRAPLSDMTWDVPHVLSHLSELWGLQEGDIVLTGTPAGVGPLEVDDVVDVRLVGSSAESAVLSIMTDETSNGRLTNDGPTLIPPCSFRITHPLE